MFDCIDKCLGRDFKSKELINESIEIAPISFMRGRTFVDAICIFDEAQNATMSQLKLFLTRFGENSKVIITGDPLQSDLKTSEQGLMTVVEKLHDLDNVKIVKFTSASIVRHPLIEAILKRLED